MQKYSKSKILNFKSRLKKTVSQNYPILCVCEYIYIYIYIYVYIIIHIYIVHMCICTHTAIYHINIWSQAYIVNNTI